LSGLSSQLNALSETKSRRTYRFELSCLILRYAVPDPLQGVRATSEVSAHSSVDVHFPSKVTEFNKEYPVIEGCGEASEDSELRQINKRHRAIRVSLINLE